MSAQGHNAFCIICAKAEELRELILIFNREMIVDGRRDATDLVYRIPNTDQTVMVTTCSAMGNMAAAVRTTQIIATRQPKKIIFLGTAASMAPDQIQIGDVVLPRKAFLRVYDKISEAGQTDYDRRKAQPGFQEFFFRDTALISDLEQKGCTIEALVAVACLNISGIELQCGPIGEVNLGGRAFRLRSPKIHEDVDIFSCGMVVDSISYRDFIIGIADINMRKAAIIDMESHGFFSAIDIAASMGIGHGCVGLMIRGISDYAGRKSETERRPEGWKEACVRNAAVVAAALIKRLSQDAGTTP